MTCSTVSISFLSTIGFCRYSATPASWARRSMFESPWPVIRMTGMPRPRPSDEVRKSRAAFLVRRGDLEEIHAFEWRLPERYGGA